MEVFDENGGFSKEMNEHLDEIFEEELEKATIKKILKENIYYKDFFTNIKFSIEDKVFYGKIDNIKDPVNFEGNTGKEVINAFHEAVDDYLEMCEELDKEPERHFKALDELDYKILELLEERCICQNFDVLMSYLQRVILKNIKDIDNPSTKEKFNASVTSLLINEIVNVSRINFECLLKNMDKFEPEEREEIKEMIDKNIANGKEHIGFLKTKINQGISHLQEFKKKK